MTNVWTRRALATAGGTLALGLVVASPAAAAELDWRLEYEHTTAEESELTAVDVDTRTGGVFAVGDEGPWDAGKPVAFRWDRAADTWRQLRSPQERGVSLTSVEATSRQSAWMVMNDSDAAGGDDGVLHWSKGTWETHWFSGSEGGDIATFGDSAVWYVTARDGKGVAHHYDGTEWTSTELPGDAPDRISDVVGARGGSVYAVGQRGDQPYAAQWDGTSWHDVSPDPVTPPEGDEGTAYLTDVAAAGGEVWATGVASSDDGARGLLYAFDGSSWVEKPMPDLTYGVAASDLAEGPNDTLWLTPQEGDEIYELTTAGWQRTTVPEPTGTVTAFRAITAAPGGPAWAVGTSETSDVEYHGVVYGARY